jgi:hypothetical protein
MYNHANIGSTEVIGLGMIEYDDKFIHVLEF